MRTLTDEEKEKMMNEIVQSIRDKRIKHSYEMTKEEFAKATGMSAGFAKKYLSEAIKNGTMTKRAIIINGKSFVVYSVI